MNIELDKYTCRRCGYKANQLTDIKRHYQKKKICPAHYLDIPYERLLKDIEENNHNTLVINNSDKVEYVTVNSLGKRKVIDKYIITIPDELQENIRLACLQNNLEEFKNTDELLHKHISNEMDILCQKFNVKEHYKIGKDVCIVVEDLVAYLVYI